MSLPVTLRPDPNEASDEKRGGATLQGGATVVEGFVTWFDHQLIYARQVGAKNYKKYGQYGFLIAVVDGVYKPTNITPGHHLVLAWDKNL